MHQLLPLKFKIGLVIAIAAAATAVISTITQSLFIVFTVVSVVDAVVVYALLRSWRVTSRVALALPLLPRWMQTELSGTWRGQIHSNWRKSPTDPPLAPIDATMTIHQDWHDVVFLLETTQMRGRSANSMPVFDRDTGTLFFRYFFETQPTGEVSDGNPPQRLGCALVTYKLAEPNALRITYTNERGPGGEIVLTRASAQKRRKRPKTLGFEPSATPVVDPGVGTKKS